MFGIGGSPGRRHHADSKSSGCQFASLILLGTGAAVIGLGAQGASGDSAPIRSSWPLGCFSIVTIVLMATQEVVRARRFRTGVIIFAGAGLLGPIGLL